MAITTSSDQPPVLRGKSRLNTMREKSAPFMFTLIRSSMGIRQTPTIQAVGMWAYSIRADSVWCPL